MYDASLTYEENYLNGPFVQLTKEKKFPKIQYIEKPKYEFLGIPLHIPFGVPAGPLLNSKFVKIALEAGFCLPTYKTVRSLFWKSNNWPNVLSIQSKQKFLYTKEHNKVQASYLKFDDYFKKNISISNSFGVPSQNPEVWTKDFCSLLPYSKTPGLHVVLSFQASNKEELASKIETKNLFFTDAQKTCELAINATKHTGFSLLEVNLSCPNEKHQPIYKDISSAVKLLSCIKQVLKEHKNIKLIAKIGVLTKEEINVFLSEASQYIDAISAINTISADILTVDGKIVLGSKSISGGVCGNLILNQGLQVTELLAERREKLGLKKQELGLIGVGGVMNIDNFSSYINAGADLVQTATGMMWNLNFAQEVARNLNVLFKII